MCSLGSGISVSMAGPGVILSGVSEVEGRKRLAGLSGELRHANLPGVPDAAALSASIGMASFDSPANLTAAIEQADSAMYV